MNVLGVSWHDRKNIGDTMSSPLLYFDFGKANTEIVRPGARPKRTPDLVVIGGGALVGPLPGIARKFRRARTVAWGVGFTIRDRLAPHHPSVYDAPARSVGLFGTRDWLGERWWVPCASCMHPAFDNPPEPTRPVVFYGHAERAPLAGLTPRLDNAEMDFARVIAFLASGSIVVTSSYHGMYWATLLGRQVIVEPFGSKFYHHRYPHPLERNWREGIDKTRCYPEALEECRRANRSFYARVMKHG
jgi:hypothetical protein